MYLFDPSLGFSTFAPLTIAVFLVFVVAGVFQKRYRVLIWFGFFIGTVAAFSIMVHINCGMIYCARYLIFTWPIVPLFLATEGYGILRPEIGKKVLYSTLFLSSCILLCINGGYGGFNSTTQWILRNVPQLYAPYSATFYCRTLGVDGGYDISDPAYYLDPETGEVRKLAYKADEGQAERVLHDLAGDEASMAYLEEKLDEHGTDGKYHYINFPLSGKCQVHEATLEDLEDRGELIGGMVVAEGHDLAVGNAGRGQLVGFPFVIEGNTVYKLEVELAEDVDFSRAINDVLAVDFYGGPDYDRGEQQATGFIQDGTYNYTFYFDSGDIDSGFLDGAVRLFTLCDTDVLIGMDLFRVTEMERIYE